MPAITVNNVSSSLAASITNAATALTVATGDGSLFPTTSAANYFYATLQNMAGDIEIIKCTTRTGDVLNVIVRAQGGTSALGWAAGDKVECRPVAAMWLVDEIMPAQLGNSGKFIKTNGTVVSWALLAQADVAGLTTADAPAFAGLGLSGNLDLNNNGIIEAKTILFNAEYDNGLSGTTKSIDFANGQKQKITLTNNCAIVLFNPTGFGAQPAHCQLKIIQSNSSSFTVSWSGSGYSASRWLGATAAPAMTTALSSEVIVNFYWDGSKFYQSMLKVGAV